MKRIAFALACLAVIASSTIASAAVTALNPGAPTTSTAGPTIRGGQTLLLPRVPQLV